MKRIIALFLSLCFVSLLLGQAGRVKQLAPGEGSSFVTGPVVPSDTSKLWQDGTEDGIPKLWNPFTGQYDAIKFDYEISDTAQIASRFFPVGALITYKGADRVGAQYLVKSSNELGAAALNTAFLKQDAAGHYVELQKQQGRYNMLHLGGDASNNIAPILQVAVDISSASLPIDLYFPDGEYLFQGTGIVIYDAFVNYYFDGGYLNIDNTGTGTYEIVLDGLVNYSTPFIGFNDADVLSRVVFRNAAFDQKEFPADMWRWEVGNNRTESQRKKNYLYFNNIVINMENYIRNNGYVEFPSATIELSPYTKPNSIDYHLAISSSNFRLQSAGFCTLRFHQIEANKPDPANYFFMQIGPGLKVTAENMGFELADEGYKTYPFNYTLTNGSDNLVADNNIFSSTKDWPNKFVYLSGGTLGDTTFLVLSRISDNTLQLDATLSSSDTGAGWITDSYDDKAFSWFKYIGDYNGSIPTASVKWWKGADFVLKESGVWSSSELKMGDYMEVHRSLGSNRSISAYVTRISADTAFIDNGIPTEWESSGVDNGAITVSPGLFAFEKCVFLRGRKIVNNGTGAYATIHQFEQCTISDVSSVVTYQGRSARTKGIFIRNEIAGLNNNSLGTGMPSSCCPNSTIIYGNPFNQLYADGNTLRNVMIHGFYGNPGGDTYEQFYDTPSIKSIGHQNVFINNTVEGYGSYALDIHSIGDVIIDNNIIKGAGIKARTGRNIKFTNNTFENISANTFSRSLEMVELEIRKDEGSIQADNNTFYTRSTNPAIRITRLEGTTIKDVLSNTFIITDSLDYIPTSSAAIGGVFPIIRINSTGITQFENLQIDSRDLIDDYNYVFYVENSAGIELFDTDIDLTQSTGTYLVKNVAASYDLHLYNSTHNCENEIDADAGIVNVVKKTYRDYFQKGITATTPGPGTSLVITHNLEQAPSYISITPGGDIGDWYVNTINSTTMTLNYTSTATTTANSVNIYWQVE